MASTGVNHVVPGGVATTVTVNYRLMGRAGVPSDELGFAVDSQAIGSTVVLNVLLWCALVVSIPTNGFQPVYGTAAAVGAVLLAAFSAANWLLDAAALWVMLVAFGHRPGVVGLLVAYGLANVMAAIPISPGGLGVIEEILIPTLVGFGTPRAEASIGVVAYVAVDRATAGGQAPGFVAEIDHEIEARN